MINLTLFRISGALMVVVLSTTLIASGVTAISGIANFEPYEGVQPNLVTGADGGMIEGKPVVRHAFLVAPNVLAITIDTYGFQRQSPVDYFPVDGDEVALFGALVPEKLWDEMGLTPFVGAEERERHSAGQFKFVYRNGQALGHLIGADNSQLWPVEERHGEGLDWAQLDRFQNYQTFVNQNTGASFYPEKIYRKTKPHGKANSGPGYAFSFGFQHQLYLQYSRALPVGEEVSIQMPALNLRNPTVTVLLDTHRLRTEAIQVNQNGYDTSQTSKTARLSTWMGIGGAVNYDWVEQFEVVNASSGDVVYESVPTLLSDPVSPEFKTENGTDRNMNRAFVYELDFSDLSVPEGIYFIRIPDLGVSFSFPVRNGVWDFAARTQLLGYYHQRSGMELTLPASEWTRPINFHPSMKTVYDVDRAKYFDRAFYNDSEWHAHNPFPRLAKSMILDSSLKNVWGGWADAADYDRNRRHLRVVNAMLMLHELNPDFFEHWKLQLPELEINNDIPDILDEALWCAELFRRSQFQDGEVIEGVESIEHPNRGEASWRDSLPLAIKPGTPSMAVYWAGVAARMSLALAPYDKALSTQYQKSALEALNWEQRVRGEKCYSEFQASSTDWMNASVFMFVLTGDENWNEIFIRHWLTMYRNNEQPLDQVDPYSLLAYALMSEDRVDSETQAMIRHSIVEMADREVAGTRENASGLLRLHGHDTNYQLVEARGSEYLMVAHQLTGKSIYLKTLLDCSNFALGMNPLNLVYTTGLGKRFVEPFFLDSEYTGKPYPVGIPAYGPAIVPEPMPEKAWGWSQRRAESFREFLYPSSIHVWPLTELYFRNVGYPAMNEFTVHQGMREQLTRWTYLTQYFSDCKN